MLHVTCNKLMGPGVSVTIDNYNGNALEQIDDVKRPVSFIIRQPEGIKELFQAQAHYYGPDTAWVVSNSDLPRAFVLALARGDLLTVSNGRGTKVADFDLMGADKGVELMRQVCRQTISPTPASRTVWAAAART